VAPHNPTNETKPVTARRSDTLGGRSSKSQDWLPHRSRPTGRLAPSPSGLMHLGNARTALLAWLSARSHGSRLVLRIEDLDRARCRASFIPELLRDFEWLGLDWEPAPGTHADQDTHARALPRAYFPGGFVQTRDEARGKYRDEEPLKTPKEAPGADRFRGLFLQSERTAAYAQALRTLQARGAVYPCSCSRADVARAARAPHAGEEGHRYPGTCRDRPAEDVLADAKDKGRAPAWRFRGEDQTLTFEDAVRGACTARVDDFVVRRADGLFAYQLAVVVDDGAMGVTEVVRGDDLLSSTGRQYALFEALRLPAPKYAHVPLVRGPSGERLAKRSRPVAIADLRAQGYKPAAVVGALAASCGLCAVGAELMPPDLISPDVLSRLSPASPRFVDGLTFETDATQGTRQSATIGGRQSTGDKNG